MANYYLDVSYISRNQGRSAAAAAAYRSGEKLRDDYYGLTHDYSRRKDVLYTEICLPTSAPNCFRCRQGLIAAIETAERRVDARLLREVRGSLPNELVLSEQVELTREYVFSNFVNLGMCADISIHEGKHPSNPAKNNPHFHALLTTRAVDSGGFSSHKNRTWDKREYVVLWREQWAKAQNRAYERKGLDVRVSHESYLVQGIDREPTKCLSRVDWQLEKRGIFTARGDENRAIRIRNHEREERQRLHQQKREQDREYIRSR